MIITDKWAHKNKPVHARIDIKYATSSISTLQLARNYQKIVNPEEIWAGKSTNKVFLYFNPIK